MVVQPCLVCTEEEIDLSVKVCLDEAGLSALKVGVENCVFRSAETRFIHYSFKREMMVMGAIKNIILSPASIVAATRNKNYSEQRHAQNMCEEHCNPLIRPTMQIYSQHPTTNNPFSYLSNDCITAVGTSIPDILRPGHGGPTASCLSRSTKHGNRHFSI